MNLEADTVQLWWQWNVLGNCKFAQRLIFDAPCFGLISHPLVVVLHFLKIRPLVGLFYLQLVFLLDPLNPTTGSVAPVFQCPTSLLHTNDFFAS